MKCQICNGPTVLLRDKKRDSLPIIQQTIFKLHALYECKSSKHLMLGGKSLLGVNTFAPHYYLSIDNNNCFLFVWSQNTKACIIYKYTMQNMHPQYICRLDIDKKHLTSDQVETILNFR